VWADRHVSGFRLAAVLVIVIELMLFTSFIIDLTLFRDRRIN
jgi:hypothetical protein